MSSANITNVLTRSLLLLLAACFFGCRRAAVVVQAQQQVQPFGELCDNVTTCLECMEADRCGFWQPGVAVGSTGLCADRCMIVDLLCYTVDDSSLVVTDPEAATALRNEICLVVDNDKADLELCGGQTDSGCDACVATILSDGISTCQWFVELQACVSKCSILGCGVTTCTEAGNNVADDVERDTQDEADAACVGMNCTVCFATETCGFWQPELDSCAASCMIADSNCYSKNAYPNMTADDICQEVANKEAHLLCTSKTNCGACVETTILAGTTTCQWFDDDGEGEQYCASGCGVDGCGKYSCEAEADDNNEEDNNTNDGGQGENAAPSPATSTAAAAKRSFMFMMMKGGIIATLIVASWNICL